MIRDHDASSPNIITYKTFPSLFFSQDHQLNALQVFWKKLQQGLPSQNIYLYTLLDLSNNKLAGEIPDTLGDLKNLKSFNLSNNKFSGGIPMSFGNLENLESLDLSSNNLSGEIPPTFGKLLQITLLDVSNNKLQGRIPNGPQMDRMNDPKSYDNNIGLCGMQIQAPCDTSEPQPPETKTENENWEDWFSWETAVIGLPSGFLSTILVMYISGYFYIAPRRGLRRNVRLRNNVFCFRL
ncbi:receptor-like protein 46 [Euphorbia lathyris]|uniref:receptor-like protein 46 n=1 Tax=Euphorbia lathyris TaxID=212925 RepID=UPI0033135750